MKCASLPLEIGGLRAGPWSAGLVAATLAGLLFFPGHARAQGAGASGIAAAREQGIEGLRLASEGNCKEAVEFLERAEKLFSAPTTLVQLGECQVKLGRLVAGSESLQRVARADLPATASPAFKAAQQKARKLLEEVLPRIPKLRISLQAPPAARPKVLLDGEEIPAVMIGIDRPTDPGAHEIEAIAPGYLRASSRVSLAEGASEKIALTLEVDPNYKAAEPIPTAPASAPASASSAPPPPTRDPTPPPPKSMVLPYTLLGVGALGLGAGAVFGLLAKGKKSHVDDQCPVSKYCPVAAKADFDSATSLATFSTIGFGVGLGAAAVGVVLLLTNSPDPAPASAPASAYRWRIEPAISPTGGPVGAQLRGVF